MSGVVSFNEVDLTEYLPPTVSDTDEFKGIVEGENPEFNLMAGYLGQFYSELFLETAESFWLELWEEAIGLSVPDVSDTELLTQARRAAIIAKLYGSEDYTFRRVYEILCELCGGSDYIVMEYGENSYTLSVLLSLKVSELLESVKELLWEITPANIALEFNLDYNAHGRLGLYTHGELAEFTHGELYSAYLERGDINAVYG